MPKVRLDVLLVEKGWAGSPNQARATILAGEVRVNGEVADKPGMPVPPTAEVQVQGPVRPYVSRGGVKLAQALQDLDLEIAGRVCLDVGASTGGFTDCLLHHGAKRVFAVDVGYGQLHWKLRKDPRVEVYERTNARILEPEMFPERPQVATLDVSFISLTQVLPAAAGVIGPEGDLLALVKPQFEARRSQVGPKGVVGHPEIHHQVLHRLWDFGEKQDWEMTGLTPSPLQGPQGNCEFWMLWRPSGPPRKRKSHGLRDIHERIAGVVDQAHTASRKKL